MEAFEDDRFVAALESLRPAPRPEFVAELDERAATGFPRRSRFGGSPLGHLVDWIKTIDPRRALIPVGATALAAVAAVTVVVAVSENGGPASTNVNSDLGGASSAPRAQSKAAAPPARAAESGPMYKTEAQSTAEAEVEMPSSAAGSAGAIAKVPMRDRSASDTGPYASQAPRREIERSAELVLGTDPAGVRKAAADVFDTVHAYRGIVLNSSIRDGAEGEAGARFELLIPSAKLGDALADFSGIATVRSRHEATADITAPTVRTGEMLRDSRARTEGLLAQLAAADTDAERAATEARLRPERRHAAYLRSRLSSLERRANLSHVSLRIETGEAGASSGGSGSWGIGEALGDAGRILTIAAGVIVVGLAIVGPIALLALLAWLANRARIRRGRQRALA